jgi:hypothetical protein
MYHSFEDGLGEGMFRGLLPMTILYYRPLQMAFPVILKSSFGHFVLLSKYFSLNIFVKEIIFGFEKNKFGILNFLQSVKGDKYTQDARDDNSLCKTCWPKKG